MVWSLACSWQPSGRVMAHVPVTAPPLFFRFRLPFRLATNMLVAMGFWEKAQAANDTLFLPSRHRTLPILATVTPIANYLAWCWLLRRRFT